MREFRRAYLWLVPLALLTTTAAFAQGGPWWQRGQVLEPDQQKFVDSVAELHQQVRAKQLELNRLVLRGDDEEDIEAKEAEVTKLRKELYRKLADKAALVTELAKPKPGEPGAPGMGRGRGWRGGRGGFGPGPGFGPRGMGPGRGLGPGMGLGRGWRGGPGGLGLGPGVGRGPGLGMRRGWQGGPGAWGQGPGYRPGLGPPPPPPAPLAPPPAT